MIPEIAEKGLVLSGEVSDGMDFEDREVCLGFR